MSFKICHIDSKKRLKHERTEANEGRTLIFKSPFFVRFRSTRIELAGYLPSTIRAEPGKAFGLLSSLSEPVKFAYIPSLPKHTTTLRCTLIQAYRRCVQYHV